MNSSSGLQSHSHHARRHFSKILFIPICPLLCPISKCLKSLWMCWKCSFPLSRFCLPFPPIHWYARCRSAFAGMNNWQENWSAQGTFLPPAAFVCILQQWQRFCSPASQMKCSEKVNTYHGKEINYIGMNELSNSCFSAPLFTNTSSQYYGFLLVAFKHLKLIKRWVKLHDAKLPLLSQCQRSQDIYTQPLATPLTST